MKKKIFIPCLIFLMFFISGCSSDNNSSSASSQKIYSPFTGQEISNDTLNRTPFMAVIENSPNARPQTGLSQADIIYETSAEALIPRFMAVFYSNYPNKIGPIRSVRPYFLTIAKEYEIPFIHCGGSDEALNEISSDASLKSINEILVGKLFWRDNSRNAPHNLYVSSENILNYINQKEWNSSSKNIFTFDDNFYSNSNLKNAENILIKINNNYNTNYIYVNNVYEKYMDASPAIDSFNNEILSFSNIIIQITDISLSEDNEHLNIRLTGTGTGYILSKGKVVNIKWEKALQGSETILYDESGNKVPLSSGKTIWHIVGTDAEIKLNN